MIERNISAEAILDYFSHGVVYQPNTIIEGVKSLPNGHFLEIFPNGDEKLTQYWDLHNSTIDLRRKLENVKSEQVIEQLRYLLNEATKYSLISDVEVGAFLSGGIDSSAVVGLMSQFLGGNINTYALGFGEQLSSIDERKYAEIAANHSKTKHLGIILDSLESEQLFKNVANDIDQPSFDGTNTWIISKEVAKRNKVALSGLGGDEIFAGYPHFFKLNFKKNVWFLIARPLKKYFENLNSLRPNSITLKIISKLSTSIEKLLLVRALYTPQE